MVSRSLIVFFSPLKCSLSDEGVAVCRINIAIACCILGGMHASMKAATAPLVPC